MLCLTEKTAEKFCACTLPKAEWTHYAHLRTGLWHLLRHGPEESLLLLRARIRALNESHGVANSESGGYHETITRFYVWQIGRFLEEEKTERAGAFTWETLSTARPHEACIDDLAEKLILRYGDKDLPLRYWSRERLFTREARLGWVEPDLAPLA